MPDVDELTAEGWIRGLQEQARRQGILPGDALDWAVRSGYVRRIGRPGMRRELEVTDAGKAAAIAGLAWKARRARKIAAA